MNQYELTIRINLVKLNQSHSSFKRKRCAGNDY